MTAVYETLIGLDKDNKTLVPRLATSWTASPDQTEFTFNLDPNAKFADGTPVTSTDVKFSWERLQGLKAASSYLVSLIKTIDDSDPHVVKVTLSAPNSAFLAQVNASYLGIVNSKVAQANGATTDPNTDKAETWFLSNSAGSGPFELDSYTEGSELKFKANPNYWGPNGPKFPEVDMKQTDSAVTQRQQLEQGAVDIAMQISADTAAGHVRWRHRRRAGAELQLRVPGAQPGREGRRGPHAGRPQGDPRGARLRPPRRRHRRRQGQAAAVTDPQRVRRHRRPRRPGAEPRRRQEAARRQDVHVRRHLPVDQRLRRRLQHGDAGGPVRAEERGHHAQPQPGGDLRVGRQDRRATASP